jgi:protein-S-isoprenylcysteine O-methyltransferase Ste14
MDAELGLECLQRGNAYKLCWFANHCGSAARCGLVFIATASLVITAKLEEGENLHKFGNAYTQYLNETKMFVPFVFR